MITRIGLAAGDIWNYLDAHNRVDQLEKIIEELGDKIERDLVLMSIGWLAREGHVQLEGEPGDYTVKLSSDQ